MSKSRQDYEREFLETLLDDSGRTLNQWMEIIENSGETKTTALTKWIKSNYDFNHMQATFLANIYLNGGKPVFGDNSEMKDLLFAKRQELLPLYNHLESELKKLFGDKFYAGPTKTYMEFKNPKLFANAKLMSSSIRVGMDLDLEFDDYVVKGKGLGAMPRISHMIEIESISDINDNLLKYLKLANERVNG